MKINFKFCTLVLILGLTTTSCYQIAPKRCVTGQVIMTERVADSEGSHYRVFIKGEEPFINTDALEIGKFNSASIQADLEEAKNSGEEVTLTVYGWRVPWMSMFENIKGFGCE